MSALTREELAVLYVLSLRGVSVLEAACIDQSAEGEPLRRGMLTCGEAMALIPAVARLVLLIDPDLADPDVLERAFADACARGATGAAN